MSNKVNEVIFDFTGEPASPDSCCTRTGYGYGAIVCTEHTAITNLFKSLCMWGGATKSYTKDGNHYKFYELSCRDRGFFESDYFKRICRPYNMKITVCESCKELYDNFYRDAK